MTVPAGLAREQYAGSGSTGPFAFNHKVFVTSHLDVTRTVAGVDTALVLTTDYSVSLASDFSSASITLVVALAVGQSLTVVLDPPIEQQIAYSDNDPFPAATHERALDLATMVSQSLAEKISRAPLLRAGSPVLNLVFPDPAANQFIGWNAGATALENKIIASSGGIALPGSSTDNAIVRWNGTTGDTLQNSVVTVSDIGILAGASVLPAATATTADTLENFFARERWVEDFGAIGDGVTDDTAAIQAAIDRAELVGGGIVRLKAKVYSCDDLVIDSTGVVLSGIAGGDLFNAATVGTVLKARAGATNVLTVGAASAASQSIRSVTVENMTIDGNSIATRGLYIRPITNSIFRNLVIKGATGTQLEHANYVDGGSYSGLNFMYQTVFDSVYVNTGSGSAKGIVLSAMDSVSGINAVSFCQFSNIQITHQNGTAFEINDSDDNMFQNIGVSRIGGGSGIGFDIVGNIRPDLQQANMFYFVHAGPGGWRSSGAAAYDNVVFGLGQVDGVPVTINSPSWLSYIMDNGAFLFPSFSADGGAGNTIVNRLKFSGAVTGSDVAVSTDGSDTNINLRITPKGSGAIIAPSANAVIGHTAPVAGAVQGGTARVGVHGISGQTQGYSTSRWTADASGTLIVQSKSRGAAVGTHTIVQNGDVLGREIFAGSDGTQFIAGAEVSAVVDGTPGTNDMPTSLVFSTTPDGAAAVVERMRIRPDGDLQFPAASFQANGTDAVTITALRPAAAATATITKWLRFRDNAGVDSYIPVWQ